jgi:hypothetical protein
MLVGVIMNDHHEAPFTLPFETFWAWLTSHPNCIVRAGTPETILYDDEDYYWHFAVEGGRTLLVQVLRGKRLVGELLLDQEQISYVQVLPPEREGEFGFELVQETETENFVAYFFVLAHGFEDQEEAPPSGRVH